MSDYDPRDFGYTQYRPGYYYKESYMKEFGGNVWQPLVTVNAGYFQPEPYVTEGEVKAFLQGAKYINDNLPKGGEDNE